MDGESVVGTVGDRIEAFRWPAAVGIGAGAFLLGYLLTVAVVYVGPSETSGGLWGVLTSIAFVFYSAHNVPVLVPDLGYVNWLQFVARPGPPEPSVPPAVFYLLPFAVVLGAGGMTARNYGDRAGEPIDAVLAGIGIAAGYWVLAVLGTFVFRTQSAFGVTSRLHLPDAALYGFVYPLVVGLLAAALVQFARYLRAEAEPSHTD